MQTHDCAYGVDRPQTHPSPWSGQYVQSHHKNMPCSGTTVHCMGEDFAACTLHCLCWVAKNLGCAVLPPAPEKSCGCSGSSSWDAQGSAFSKHQSSVQTESHPRRLTVIKGRQEDAPCLVDSIVWQYQSRLLDTLKVSPSSVKQVEVTEPSLEFGALCWFALKNPTDLLSINPYHILYHRWPLSIWRPDQLH